jgi:hypothetical protein
MLKFENWGITGRQAASGPENRLEKLEISSAWEATAVGTLLFAPRSLLPQEVCQARMYQSE